MTVPAGAVLLGTVALEPNRWATVDPSGAPQAVVSALLAPAAAAGFDGLELWEGHVTKAPPDEADAVLAGPLPIAVFNTYASFDEPTDAAALATATGWIARTGAGGVKFNVGTDPDVGRYAARVAAWLDGLPAAVTLLCECHVGTAVADDPSVAARFLAATGPVDRVGAIVHTHESADELRARFDAYGDRIAHVHVNHLDPKLGRTWPLAEVRDRLAATVELLRSLGFAGSWTIEFVDGLLTDRDHPDLLLQQAVEDLAVLREVLG